MGKTSGLNNTGVMHAVHKFGQRPLCGRRDALMATEIAAFRQTGHQCKRCAARLAEMDARSSQKVAVTTIDITPTWVAVLPLYLAAITDGSPSAQDAARSELRRMAELADLYVASSKQTAA